MIRGLWALRDRACPQVMPSHIPFARSKLKVFSSFNNYTGTYLPHVGSSSHRTCFHLWCLRTKVHSLAGHPKHQWIGRSPGVSDKY